MTAMIALVGAQPLPNFIPIRTEKPSAALFVYTDRTERVYKQLEVVLRQETSVFGLQTDAYNIPTIEQAVRDWIEKQAVASDTLVFNITGGTKTMSLALYRVAERYQAPMLYVESERNQNRMYRYIWSNGLHLECKDLLPECITLDDFLNMYFGHGEWKEYGPGNQEGSAFEQAIAHTLQQAGYEVKLGVKVLNNQIDIDVIVRHENQVGIIEAKAGNNGSRMDGIKQLNNAAKQLGLYTRSFYVITVPPNERHEDIVNASNIKVVSLSGYVPGSKTLPSDQAQQLITRVDSALKG